MLKIYYFGRLSDRAGRREESLALPVGVNSVSTLKNWLDTKHGLGGALQDKSVKTMINQSLIHKDIVLQGDEEIGFLPPVGGG
ncbi:MAG: MoaD/ThiS family protein [Robiginitomaculum sp.]|nr:MoaD/ThiS family protein [Robiginitomaculum sp.]